MLLLLAAAAAAELTNKLSPPLLQYGPTFKVFFGGLCAIVVSDPVNARCTRGASETVNKSEGLCCHTLEYV